GNHNMEQVHLSPKGKNKNILFMGPLYQNDKEAEILASSVVKGSVAPNLFQWNLLHGMEKHLGKPVQVINALPVGVWPKHYKNLVLNTRFWDNDGTPCYEVGTVNLPVIKQLGRVWGARKILKKWAREDTEIVIYSAYMPFLQALRRLPRNVKITIIITDLPEYYDLGKTTSIRKVLRSWQNKIIYSCFERVNRFIILTEQMREPLHIGNRPWLLLEGICSETAEYVEPASASDEKIILYTGTLHYQYGIKNLLDAFEAIDDSKARLWICGGGEAEKEIIRLIKKDPRVHFWGFCDQKTIRQYQGKASILVNPRPNEGEYTKYSFPSKTMEYMASGKPIVMCKLDGVPSEYEPFLYMIEGNTTEALKKMLTYVLEHPKEAQQKGAAAQRFVRENKSASKQAERVLKFIEIDVANAK
ncbi:MAG: glycosyltransferase family 4 protein, partial [Evtepia sp.]